MGFNILSIVPALNEAADRLIPDVNKRSEWKAQQIEILLTAQRDLERASSEIIKAEVQSESFLTRNWRPMTMLIFVFLISARYLGFADGASEAFSIELIELLKIGLGGYVVGRTAEKIVREMPDGLFRRK